jgi:TPR repeat protein
MLKQDCAPAQFNVGNCFLEGVGTERSLDKAIAWFERAAEEHGHARAMAQLGQIYSEHKKDQAKGYEYFLKAVKHGFTTDDL